MEDGGSREHVTYSHVGEGTEIGCKEEDKADCGATELMRPEMVRTKTGRTRIERRTMTGNSREGQGGCGRQGLGLEG